MKRYRILPFFDFDTRSVTLSEQICDEWEENVKAMHLQNRESTIAGLKNEYGEIRSEQKIKNFIDLGPKPISIIAFHNVFFSQVRDAFVVGSYYPALTGACALGERILNHLILALREDFRSSPEYKRICTKDSFDDWTLAIDTLVAWNVLLPSVVSNFREMMTKRHKAIHFRPETDQNAKELALDAIKCLQKIIGEQFSGFGPQPWFITSIPGEIYIKKGWEDKPFIKSVYLKNGVLVGPKHKIVSIHPKIHVVDPDYGKQGPEISDNDFSRFRKEFNDNGQKS